MKSLTATTFALMLATVLSSNTASGQSRTFVTDSRLALGTESNRSASARIGDLDGDGDMDVVVANGRHWPQQNFAFLNQGRGRFTVQRRLGTDQCTTYATELADLDGDGDLDVAVGNDMAPNRIFLNDGSGQFQPGNSFGDLSSIRSLTVADIDSDGDIDILATSRGRQNKFYLNDGNAKFDNGHPFGGPNDSTIDVAVVDWNADKHLDLVLANRDGQQSFVLINDGQEQFKTRVPFGSKNDQTRAIVVADVNADGNADLIAGNIGRPNKIYFSNGKGEIEATSVFGQPDGRTYSLATADMDNDKDIDLIVGNSGQQNAVYLNSGDGSKFERVAFGGQANATYGVAVGDINGDGYADIAVADSDERNFIFANRAARRSGGGSVSRSAQSTPSVPMAKAASSKQSVAGKFKKTTPGWPSFRGHGSNGVAAGFPMREKWNADAKAGDIDGVLWQAKVPGLGHSSPTISGDRVFLATSISSDGPAPLNVSAGGRPDSADDNGEQSWVVLCYDRLTGKELWRKTAHKGKPRATRHSKATHANTSVTVSGTNVVAFFGSEGIHCFDLDGNLKWTRDLGTINISKYGVGWGFASSPSIHKDRIAIVCDDPANPFVAALDLADGSEVWRTSRKDICVRSWGTPFIHSSGDRTQAVINGWPWVMSYDLKTGKELWRIKGGGDNPVPTPFEANGWIYVTSAHGAESPIYVVRPDAEGDISPPKDTGKNKSIVWSVRRGGCYMSTPVVYGDYLYLGNSNGAVRCFNAKTGEKIYEKRLGSKAGIISSLVAADGKVYCPSENGTVYVLKAGPEFEVLAKNNMGNPCFASPAISEGVLYFRTTDTLFAIK